MLTWTAAAFLALSALTQDKPAPKREDHEDLTPEKAIEMLKECRGS
jgi:hypothetical protein